MFHRLAAWALSAVALGLPVTAEAQNMLSIGNVRTAPGTTLTVPVDVTALSPPTALNVRLRFDPTFLSLAGISGGPLLSPSHEIFYSTPDDGQLNIVVYSPTGSTPFTAASSIALELTFVPSQRVQIGHVTEIVFDSDGSFRLAPSDLSDPAGVSVPHTRAAGRVSFITTARNWQLYE